MKKSCSSIGEAARAITRAVISASSKSSPTRSWNATVEQTLHNLNIRHCLTPSLVSQIIENPLLTNHHSLALGFFNWASQQPNFSHTSLTYHSILRSLSLSRHFSSVVDKLFKQMRLMGFGVEPSIYGCVIGSLIRGKKTQNAFLLFDEVGVMMCGEVGIGICNSLLAALAADGFLDDACKVFDRMRVRGVGFNTLGFGVFLWRFCENAEIGKVLDLVDKVRGIGFSEVNGSIVAVLIVHGLCRATRVSDAFWVLDELRKRDCKPDFMAYRIVTEGFRFMGSSVDVAKVLKQKRKLGVAPRSNDYKEFIFNLISERRLFEAKELGEVIVNGNFSMEDDVLNALIGSVSSVDPDSAILFLKFMVGKEKFPTLLTLSNLSRNLCKHGKTGELLETFQILSGTDFFSDLESYNVMVSYMCKAGLIKDAYGVLQEMKKKGISPNVSSYNSVMEACCREDLMRPAKRLWDEMFANGCGGNLRTYNILIQKFSEIGQIEEAQRLFHHMLVKGVVPDTTSYRSLVVGLSHEDNVDAAFEIYNKSVNPDLMLAQTTLVPFLCKGCNFIAASKLLCSHSSNVEDTYSHVILLRCLAEAGEMQIALEHTKCVGEASPSKLQAIFTELFGSLNLSSAPQQILPLLQAMQRAVQILSSTTCATNTD